MKAVSDERNRETQVEISRANKQTNKEAKPQEE